MTYKTLWGSYYLTHLGHFPPLSLSCSTPNSLVAAAWLYPARPRRSPGSASVVLLMPCSFSLTISLRMFGPFLPAKHGWDFSSSERRFWTTQLVWPLPLTLSHGSDLCHLYDIVFLPTFISIEFELQRTVALVYLCLGHKKKKKKGCSDPDAFWERSVFHWACPLGNALKSPFNILAKDHRIHE